VAFSPDGKTLASAGADGTVRLWDVGTRRALDQPLEGHNGVAYGVAFSPDGKTLASAGADGTARLWDVGTRSALGQPLEGHDGDVTSVAFSPDGKTLASAGDDGTVRLWDPILWSNSRRELRRRVCAAVMRSLSRAEWRQFLPGEPYHDSCPRR
jgi:WD40 repeat protein